MAKLKELFAYKNPWLINWLKSPDKFFTLFVAWIIYAFVSRLFGLNTDYPLMYPWISKIMFWPSVLFGGWNLAKPALYRYLYSEEMPIREKRTEERGQRKEESEIKPEKKESTVKRKITDRELLKYFWHTLTWKTPTAKKDTIYGIIITALVFILLQNFSGFPIFIFFLEFNDFSFYVSQWEAYFVILFLGALAGIIFIYYLSIWRYYHSSEAKVKKEEIKEITPQSQKSKSGWQKFLYYLKIYFIAGIVVSIILTLVGLFK